MWTVILAVVLFIMVGGFVCQLTTNDAKGKFPLGTVSDSFERSGFDTTTIAGALEYIVSYVQETWDCTVVDLWSDEALNNITDEQRKLYMLNGIHPTKAGYWEWWLEPVEAGIISMIEE